MSVALQPTPLETPEAVDAVLERSAERPQLIFKHSVHCGLSGMAMDELQTHLARPEPAVDYWLVTVQSGRAASQAVERRLGVRHESPQAILVRDGKAVWSASHRRVTARSLAEATAQAAGVRA